MSHDVSSLPPALRHLETSGPHYIVGTLLSSNHPGPLASALSAALTALSRMDTRALTKRLLDTLTDLTFKAHFARAIAAVMAKYPVHTAFLVVVVVSSAAMGIGFGTGPLGPVVGNSRPPPALSYTHTRARR